MNRLEDNKYPQQGEEIDALLTAFYQAQLPKTWPAFHPPRREKVQPFTSAEPSRFAISSKFALALSLGLLMLCGWLLSGNVSTTRKGLPSEITGPGTASRERLEPSIPDTQPIDPTGKQSGKDKGEIDREQGDPEIPFDRHDRFPNR